MGVLVSNRCWYLTPKILIRTDWNLRWFKFEYSSIFYSSGPLVFHYLSAYSEATKQLVPKIKTIFHILFAITFIKYRVWDYSHNVIFNPEIYTPYKFSHYAAFIQLITTSFSFYALNLYWTRLILVKLIGSRKNSVQ